MNERSTTTLLILCLVSSCARLIGANFDDRNGSGDGGSSDAVDTRKTTEAGAPPRPDGGAPETGIDAADSEHVAPDARDDANAADIGDAIEDAIDARSDDGDPDANADRPPDDRGDAGPDGPDPSSDANDDGVADVHQDRGEPNVPPTLYIAATTDNNGLWLFDVPIGSITDLGSNFPPPVDVLAEAGPIGLVDDVEIQSVGPEVFVIARVGSNAHNASVRGDAWTAWQPVATDVNEMALANVDGYLWACLIGANGRLRLMSRRADGAWQDHGDVMEAASIPGGEAPAGLNKVECTGVGSDLDVYALDTVGHLWNATKAASGWSPFRRVLAAGDGVYSDVDTCNAAGDLHVLLSTTTLQYHAIRPANGSLSGFRDVEWAGGVDPMGNIVAGAEASLLSEVEWLQLNSLGEIWISTRFRCCAGPYQRFAAVSPSGRPFASLSATGVLPF
jgi:hypothetical protein